MAVRDDWIRPEQQHQSGVGVRVRDEPGHTAHQLRHIRLRHRVQRQRCEAIARAEGAGEPAASRPRCGVEPRRVALIDADAVRTEAIADGEHAAREIIARPHAALRAGIAPAPSGGGARDAPPPRGDGLSRTCSRERGVLGQTDDSRHAIVLECDIEPAVGDAEPAERRVRASHRGRRSTTPRARR